MNPIKLMCYLYSLSSYINRTTDLKQHTHTCSFHTLCQYLKILPKLNVYQKCTKNSVFSWTVLTVYLKIISEKLHQFSRFCMFSREVFNPQEMAKIIKILTGCPPGSHLLIQQIFIACLQYAWHQTRNIMINKTQTWPLACEVYSFMEGNKLSRYLQYSTK